MGLVASMQAGLALRMLGGVRDDTKSEHAPLLELDAWHGDVRSIRVPKDPNCPACGQGNFEFLDGADDVEAVSLCGRNTVQVLSDERSGPLDTAELTARLERAGASVQALGPLVRFEADGHRFTVFPGGRTLVEGTEDTGRALALVARWVGA